MIRLQRGQQHFDRWDRLFFNDIPLKWTQKNKCGEFGPGLSLLDKSERQIALLMSFGPQEAAVSLAVGVNYLANVGALKRPQRHGFVRAVCWCRVVSPFSKKRHKCTTSRSPDGLQSNSNGLQPTSDDLQPTSDVVSPEAKRNTGNEYCPILQ